MSIIVTLILALVTIYYYRSTHNSAGKLMNRQALLKPVFDFRAQLKQELVRTFKTRWLSNVRACMSIKIPANGKFVRLGNAADGGYVVLGEGESYDTLLSYGVRDEVSFELDLVARFPKAQVHIVDHTIVSLPRQYPQFKFHRQGLGGKQEQGLDSHECHMLQFVSCSRRVFVQIDIVFDEYESLLFVPDQLWQRVRQIAIDLHDVTPFNGQVTRLVITLASQFSIIHVHANNAAGVTDESGVIVPSVSELTLVQNDPGVSLAHSQMQLPCPLDQPNDPAFPDLSLPQTIIARV